MRRKLEEKRGFFGDPGVFCVVFDRFVQGFRSFCSLSQRSFGSSNLVVRCQTTAARWLVFLCENEASPEQSKGECEVSADGGGATGLS